MKYTDSEIILFDNGSLRPESILAFRSLSHEFSKIIKQTVTPAGLLHSFKVPASDLNGHPANKLETLIREILQKKARTSPSQFILLPFFIGESRAISEYLPKILQAIKSDYPESNFIVGLPLSGKNPEKPDIRIAQIIKASIYELISNQMVPHASVGISLVDHGSPAIEVTRVRNAVRNQLAELLDRDSKNKFIVEAYSMERREETEYDFNEPTLDKITQGKAHMAEFQILASLFLLPGRHAGDGGDVEQILLKCLNKRLNQTPLLCYSPIVLEILKDRLTGCLHSPFLKI